MILLLLLLFQYSTSQLLEWNHHLEYVELGQNLTLFCDYKIRGWNFHTKTWFGGDRNRLIYKDGLIYRRKKYSARVIKRGFYLTIHNLNKKDLDAKYKCSLGNIETEFKKILFKTTTTQSITITTTTKLTTTTKIHTEQVFTRFNLTLTSVRPTNLATTLHYQFFGTLILILSNHG